MYYLTKCIFLSISSLILTCWFSWAGATDSTALLHPKSTPAAAHGYMLTHGQITPPLGEGSVGTLTITPKVMCAANTKPHISMAVNRLVGWHKHLPSGIELYTFDTNYMIPGDGSNEIKLSRDGRGYIVNYRFEVAFKQSFGGNDQWGRHVGATWTLSCNPY